MRSLIARLRQTLPLRTALRYLGRGGPNQATLVAWNLLFSVFPIALLAVTAAGLIFQDPEAGRQVAHALASLLPGGNGRAVTGALSAFHRESGWLALAGGIGLLWSGTALFSAMDTAFAGVSGGSTRGFLAQKLTAVAMIVIFTVLAVPVVLSSSLLATLESLAGLPAVLRGGPLALAGQVVLSILVGWLLFTAIYGLVPARRPRLRAVLAGGLAAGILFEALSLLFPVYFHFAHGFSSYGETFALFFLILTYSFLVAQVTVLGYCVALEWGARPAPPARGPTAPTSPEAAAPEVVPGVSDPGSRA